MMDSKSFYLPGMSVEELKNALTAAGEKGFRGKQIADWLYGKCEFDPAEMKNLPQSLRQWLKDSTGSPRSKAVEKVGGSGGTTKLLLELDDGEKIEMVLIPAPERMTFCLSTQVGCPVRCRFCASGAHGLVRNLRWDEMLEEFYYGVQAHGALPDNIVFMGIGEGLLNFDNLKRTLEVLSDGEGNGFGMSPRRITVSTSGYIPGMMKFAQWGRPFNLAVSLHAVDDKTRSILIPDHCRYPIAEVLEACRKCSEATGRMPTFEYTLIDGINDDPAMARKLGKLAKDMHAKVNLIAYNPVDAQFRRPGEKRLQDFMAAVNENCASVTMRIEKGSSAASACGQLRIRAQQKTRENEVK